MMIGLAVIASCDALEPHEPVDPTGSFVRDDGASITIARAVSSAPHNYRLDLHQTAQPGGYVQAGDDCYIVVVGTLNGNKFTGSSDLDEDDPASINPANLRRGVQGRTLGLEVRFTRSRASVIDHFEGHDVCGAAFSGSYRKTG